MPEFARRHGRCGWLGQCASNCFWFRCYSRGSGRLIVMGAPPGASPARASFLSRWEGPLIGHKGQIPHTLVVERISGNVATVVWSSGDSGATSAHVRRLDGAFKGEHSLVLYTLGSPMSYRMNPDGTLSSVYSYFGGIELRGTMKKVAGPTVPYVSTPEVTNWPMGIENLSYVAETTSAIRATLPEQLNFTVPADATRAKWVGKWGGSPCTKASCSTKLAVLSIEGDEARVYAVWAGSSGTQANGHYLAKFVGNELRVVAADGEKLTYRMRNDNELELYHLRPAGNAGWGVLARE